MTLKETVEIIACQEVHSAPAQVPEFLIPKDRGHRKYPLHLRQFEKLRTILRDTHVGYFAPSFKNGLHDLERSEYSVNYGLAMFVRRELSHTYRHGMAYRRFDQLNDGRPAARSIQAVIVYHETATYVIVNFHGLWNRNGKSDCPERSHQSGNVNAFLRNVVSEANRERIDPVPIWVILGGDLNLTSDTHALALLCRCTVFDHAGCNLNELYGITDTRTYHYPSDKPSREADFVIISPGLVEKVVEYRAIDEPVVSDHKPLFLSIDTD